MKRKLMLITLVVIWGFSAMACNNSPSATENVEREENQQLNPQWKCQPNFIQNIRILQLKGLQK